jgi:predicted HicB family RNase H-like nuclease
MDNILYHGLWRAAITFSGQDECLVAKVLDIDDSVTFEAQTVRGLKSRFKTAVNDYIATCKAVGKEPQYPDKTPRRKHVLKKRAYIK